MLFDFSIFCSFRIFAHGHGTANCKLQTTTKQKDNNTKNKQSTKPASVFIEQCCHTLQKFLFMTCIFCEFQKRLRLPYKSVKFLLKFESFCDFCHFLRAYLLKIEADPVVTLSQSLVARCSSSVCDCTYMYISYLTSTTFLVW